MTRSLRIGSDALGWQEFGREAQLGHMTRGMPGGDGSLDFILPGDSAWRQRNVLVPEARVILTVDGEPVYGGRLVCDPLRHRLGAQDTLELAAAGLWGMAGRNNRCGYLGVDTDLDPWQQYRGIGEHSNRFTVAKEGFLHLRGEDDRSYVDGDACRLYYWLHDGLASIAGGLSGMNGAVSGLKFEYKSHFTSANWSFGIVAGDNPTMASTGLFAWGPFTSTDPEGSKSAWTAATVHINGVFTLGSKCLMLVLEKVGATGSPPGDQWVKLRWGGGGGVYGRWIAGSPPTADTSVTIADVLTDCADWLDIAAANIRISGLTTVLEEFVARYPSNIAAVIAQATLMEAAPVEAYFDLAPDSSERFTANARPATVDVTRNCLWSVGGRGGESLAGLQRDWEATPEQVEVLYAVKGDATLPDGMVKAAQYPASVSATYPLVESVDMTGEPPMTAALAAQYAQAIYTARQASLYSGDVTLPQTALTDKGQEVPTVHLRPGDRLGVPSRTDVPAAGLYVAGTSYDWRSGTCTATVGEPWDPLGWRPRTAAAAVSGGGGGFKGGITRKGGGYRRRSGVV